MSVAPYFSFKALGIFLYMFGLHRRRVYCRSSDDTLHQQTIINTSPATNLFYSNKILKKLISLADSEHSNMNKPSRSL